MVRILAATDFSEESKPVLDFTAEMVKKSGGKMYLLHVVEPCALNAAGSLPADELMGNYGASLPNAEDYELCKTILEAANTRAKRMAEAIHQEWGIPIYGKAEECEDIVESVHDFCKRHNVNILVIGNRHHSLLSSILLGNTAEKLVRAASIPVTVVPCGAKASAK